jgi:hypothetical protein
MGRNGPSQKGADIMNVHIVSANIRYSAEAKGAWRTIELGAEAAVAPNEDWHIAQEQLYHRLGQQMKSLWNNGSGSGKALSGSESHVQPTPPTSSLFFTQLPEHCCPTHQTSFKRYEKNGQTWYSHRQGNDWCKENREGA